MKNARLLLLPFAWIYGLITGIRNSLYNSGIFNTYKIPGKSICIGNLSVGGTGKSPQVDYLIHLLSQNGNSVAVLSRGYGRSTRGLLEVNITSTATEVGDEPLMYKFRHGDHIHGYVAENRRIGIEKIRSLYPQDIILLDDAFQHRAVEAGLNIILTDYNHRFTKDFMLPAGNLREWKRGKNRADIIVVTKCPSLSSEEMSGIKEELKFENDHIFFSNIKYGEIINMNNQKSSAKNILLVTGIANSDSLLQHLKKSHNVIHLKYSDHFNFKDADIEEIHEKFDSFADSDKIIVTTEKDLMRLKAFHEVKNRIDIWFYQPIEIEINEQQKFNQLLNEYVEQV